MVAFIYNCLSFNILTLRAVNEARTRDPQLGKLVLYQLSYYHSFTLLSRYRDSNPGPIHYE